MLPLYERTSATAHQSLEWLIVYEKLSQSDCSICFSILVEWRSERASNNSETPTNRTSTEWRIKEYSQRFCLCWFVRYRNLIACWPPSSQSVSPCSRDDWVAMECWQGCPTTGKITSLKPNKVCAPSEECQSIKVKNVATDTLQNVAGKHRYYRRTVLLYNFFAP